MNEIDEKILCPNPKESNTLFNTIETIAMNDRIEVYLWFESIQNNLIGTIGSI
jgi:hypothetical protein